MPSWFSPLWDVLKDPNNQRVIEWLGSGIVVIAGGIWVVVKFFAERKNIDLVRSLLEQGRVGPQAPGSQQAVAKAVEATAKDAKAGKPRAKQALEFLKAGKIAEAVPLYQAEAAEKDATSRSSAKEAADAYRNLGAIAGLADPKRALEAYENAVKLNPDDLDSLYWVGRIQIYHGNLNEAQTRLESVLKLATGDQPDYQYQCRALVRLGDIKKQRGDLAGALKSYRDSLAIAERRAKSDPGNKNWPRDLSNCYDRIGNVQMDQGDLSAARQSYYDSLAIRDKEAKSDPGDDGWQRDLSVSFNKIGDVQGAKGDLAGALKSYRDSLAIAGEIQTRQCEPAA